MSATVDFDTVAQWDANTRVVFFDWGSDQVISSSGAAVADSNIARNAAAQVPAGNPGSVSIPANAAPGTYYALAFAGPTLTTADEARLAWGTEIPLRYDGSGNLQPDPLSLSARRRSVVRKFSRVRSSGPRIRF